MQEFNTDPNWMHIVPFAALMARNSPPNRPMATRLVEQFIVAILAGGGGSYVALQVSNAIQDEQIKAMRADLTDQTAQLREQMRQSEERMSRQIIEMRQRMYK